MTRKATPDQLAALIETNTDDMLAAWGLERRWRWPPLRWLCRPAATWLARQALAFDGYVGDHGLAAGAGWMLRQHVRQVCVTGAQQMPASGPLLIVANHPGLTDTIALFASLPRTDLRVIAADRPFLRALPNLGRSLLSLSTTAGDRIGVTRAAIAHLRVGGALLTFPGGEIEPDPALRPDARAALADWSASTGLFVRAVPSLHVSPVIVSGVLSPAAQRHPLTLLRRRTADRERFGAMLQVVVPAFRQIDVRVAIGAPLRAADLMVAGSGAAEITRAIVAAAGQVIDQEPAGWRWVVGPNR